jgi:hypothetical protein
MKKRSMYSLSAPTLILHVSFPARSLLQFHRLSSPSGSTVPFPRFVNFFFLSSATLVYFGLRDGDFLDLGFASLLFPAYASLNEASLVVLLFLEGFTRSQFCYNFSRFYISAYFLGSMMTLRRFPFRIRLAAEKPSDINGK